MAFECPHVTRLLAEHRQLSAIGKTLMGLVVKPLPPPADVLGDIRWELARTVLRHLPVEDRYVTRRLLVHHRPAAVETAERFRRELENTYGPFRRHSETWTVDAAIADWQTYRFATSALLTMLEIRIEREETELYPHLDDAPAFLAERTADAHNFAGDAWAIRERLGR